MLAAGGIVRLLPPFGSVEGQPAMTIDEVQFVAPDGSISTEPTSDAQCLLSGDGLDRVAFSARYIEKI